MNQDKKTIYGVSSVVFAVLLAALFINVKTPRILTACLIVPLAVITLLLVRKRCSFSINKRDVLLLSSIVAVLYAVLREMTGIYFTYYKNPYFISWNVILTYILPLAAIIVSSELIRSVLLAQKNKLVSGMTFAFCVFADVLCFYNLTGISNFNRFMDLVGLALFPAITANLYYHYIAKRYGPVPNIVFRLITTLYLYFLPTVARIPDALTSCINVIFPILLFALVASMFEKEKKRARSKGKKASALAMALTILFMVAISMLISCQFRFGAIVVATESMTGEINRGDMIVYERYDGQPIKEGQVIVFLDNDSKIVHRVVKIETIGGEIRYYTKGDANEDLDMGYRTQSDIFGLTDIKLAFVGYPTLWLRELIQN